MKLLEFFSLITEVKCPKCGKDGAYVGFNDVECQSTSCNKKNGTRPVKGHQNSGYQIVEYVKDDLNEFINSGNRKLKELYNLDPKFYADAEKLLGRKFTSKDTWFATDDWMYPDKSAEITIVVGDNEIDAILTDPRVCYDENDGMRIYVYDPDANNGPP
jgi:hypothetical protein